MLAHTMHNGRHKVHRKDGVHVQQVEDHRYEQESVATELRHGEGVLCAEGHVGLR
jgi:hypothetical protein